MRRNTQSSPNLCLSSFHLLLPNVNYCQLDHLGINPSEICLSRECIWKYSLQNVAYSAQDCTCWHRQYFHSKCIGIMFSRGSHLFIGGKSTLLQAMAWYLTAPTHYLKQYWLMYLIHFWVIKGQMPFAPFTCRASAYRLLFLCSYNFKQNLSDIIGIGQDHC